MGVSLCVLHVWVCVSTSTVRNGYRLRAVPHQDSVDVRYYLEKELSQLPSVRTLKRKPAQIGLASFVRISVHDGCLRNQTSISCHLICHVFNIELNVRELESGSVSAVDYRSSSEQTVGAVPSGDVILALAFVSVSAASSLSELSSLHDGGNSDFRHTYQTVQMKALPPIMDDRSLRAAPPRQRTRVRPDRINQSDDELDRR